MKRHKGRKKRRNKTRRVWTVRKGLRVVGEWISSNAPSPRRRITMTPVDTESGNPLRNRKVKPRSVDHESHTIQI